MLGFWLRRKPSEAEVRSEIWSLGTRHRGEPLEGARAELRAADLSPDRAALLRECVARLQA
jgi:hypothetical protein